ncbi:MAG: DUF3108 domain-containing protein [Gallionella sp.]
MIATIRTPGGRFALAIVLSLAIHAAILWLPYITLPQPAAQLPPLSVRLEPLPQPVKLLAKNTGQAKPVPAKAVTRSENGKSTDSANESMAPMKMTRPSTAAQPFPKHLQLTFSVYQGAGGLMSGEIRQQFDVRGDRYNLESMQQSAGLASLHDSNRIILDSRGKITENGLQPDIFEEQSITRNGKHSMRATFDRAAGKLHYSNAGETVLPENAQDSLSFLYQLAKLPMGVESFPLPVSDGEQLHQYQIEIGTKEDLDTPMGKLRTLQLHQIHNGGEAYFDIWLGLEYRLLPVKFRLVDGSGAVTEEYVISSIRAADE